MIDDEIQFGPTDAEFDQTVERARMLTQSSSAAVIRLKRTNAELDAEVVKLDSEAEAASEPAKPPPEPPWPEMDSAAYYGLAGDFVRATEPHTEADSAGLLVQFLVTFGNIIGPEPYCLVESDRHHANLFALLVGNSSRGRKGTSGGRVRLMAQAADEVWSNERNAAGLSSGEGLINAVRDKVTKWNAKDQTSEIVDPGVADKRLLVTEGEFAGTLSVMERPGNTLSPVIRNAWDGLSLQTLTRSSPLRATGTHISIVGHITKDELKARLTRTDMANGFANRILFALVRRSKHLPYGGHVDDATTARLSERFKQAVQFAKMVGRVKMTDAPAKAWGEAYEELSAERPGLLGAVTARAEAQVIRLSLIFALLDSKDLIDIAHLNAAMAVWAYCDQSAYLIFGDSLGDPVADEILSALRRTSGGMTRTAISNLFGRNRNSDQIGAALAKLHRLGLARFEEQKTGGRAAETWFAMGVAGR
jgi:hypothetical protein